VRFTERETFSTLPIYQETSWREKVEILLVGNPTLIKEGKPDARKESNFKLKKNVTA
jgi:hypothetical protein